MIEKFFIPREEVIADVDLAVVVVNFHRGQLVDKNLAQLRLGAPSKNADPRERGHGKQAASRSGEQLRRREPHQRKRVGDQTENQRINVT